MDEPPSSHVLGRTGEAAAVNYLENKGYRILATGFRLGRGEVDIVARDGPTLVFLEVKTRSGEEFGLAEEAVTEAKQRQVRRIAQGFLMMNRIVEGETPCRFDVLTLVPAAGGGFRIHHIANAF